MTMTDAAAPRGLKGVIVADTELGDVRGLEGFYHYRQYSAPELAAVRTFEDVWYLLFEGELPSTSATRRVRPPHRRRAVPTARGGDAPTRTGRGPAASARRAAHRALAARRGRGHASHVRRRSGDHPHQRDPAGCRDAGADRRSVPRVTRAGAGRAARRPRARGQLPLDDRRRGPRSASRACRGAVPDPRHRPRLQRVDVHGARGDVHRRRRRCRGGGWHRRVVGPAPRWRPEPRTRHPRRHRHARPHRSLGARRGRCR